MRQEPPGEAWWELLCSNCNYLSSGTSEIPLQSCSCEVPGGHLVPAMLKLSCLLNCKWGCSHKHDWAVAAQTKQDFFVFTIPSMPVCSCHLFVIILFYLLLWPALKYIFSEILFLHWKASLLYTKTCFLTSNSENWLALSSLPVYFRHAG